MSTNGIKWHHISEGDVPCLDNRDYMRCIVERPLQNGESFYIIADCERVENGYRDIVWFDIEDRIEVENFNFTVEKWCPLEDILEELNMCDKDI